MERWPSIKNCSAQAVKKFFKLASHGQTVAFSTRRAKHFRYSEIMHIVQPHAQKYLSFRKDEVMI